MRSDTDLHWEKQAISESKTAFVNIHDPYQRELENQFILRHLRLSDNALEVGCGNGYSTEIFRKHVNHIDAFDYSPNMISRAKNDVKENKCRFFQDNILSPSNLSHDYDVAICVRVLINLRNLEEQKVGLSNVLKTLKPKGKFILIEGFSDGFDALNEERSKLSLPNLKPAAINFYSKLSDLLTVIKKDFSTVDQFHTGFFDYLTRVVYPHLVGANNVIAASNYTERFMQVSTIQNPEAFSKFARLRGFVFVKN